MHPPSLGGHDQASPAPTQDVGSGPPPSSSHPPGSISTGDYPLHSPMPYVSETMTVTASPDPDFIHLITQSCLVGKAFGDPPLKYIIEGRLTRQWKYLKGEVTFVPMGNFWFLIEFANKEDRDYGYVQFNLFKHSNQIRSEKFRPDQKISDQIRPDQKSSDQKISDQKNSDELNIAYVWENRPWFVQGLNFVLLPWSPTFCPYSTPLIRIDQWLRIYLLPIQFWTYDCLSQLLNPVGAVVRVDPNTLMRKKVRFARVCVSVSIVDPVPGFIFVTIGSTTKKLHLNYEGMLEVCPLCGDPTHALEACPNKVVSNMHLIVEQQPLQPSSALTPIQGPTNWVRIVPKKKTSTPLAKPTHQPTPHSPHHSSSSSHHSHFLLPVDEPTHNKFAPLLDDDNLSLALRSPSPVSPQLFEYGSNLNDPDDNEFYEAMGIDIPSSSESSKRKRISLDNEKPE
ncbi:hypothetical protein RDABS01_037912 [Bienertia sinuspersici]